MSEERKTIERLEKNINELVKASLNQVGIGLCNDVFTDIKEIKEFVFNKTMSKEEINKKYKKYFCGKKCGFVKNGASYKLCTVCTNRKEE